MSKMIPKRRPGKRQEGAKNSFCRENIIAAILCVDSYRNRNIRIEQPSGAAPLHTLLRPFHEPQQVA